MNERLIRSPKRLRRSNVLRGYASRTAMRRGNDCKLKLVASLKAILSCSDRCLERLKHEFGSPNEYARTLLESLSDRLTKCFQQSIIDDDNQSQSGERKKEEPRNSFERFMRIVDNNAQEHLPEAHLFCFELEIRLFMQNASCTCCCGLRFQSFCERLSRRFSGVSKMKIKENATTINNDLKKSTCYTLTQSYGIELVQYIEYSGFVTEKRNKAAHLDAVGASRQGKLRVQQNAATGIFWDVKFPITSSIISLSPSLCGQLCFSIERKKQRLCESNESDIALCRQLLLRAENYATAVSRYYHPDDHRLSITWRETSDSDRPSIVVEYDFTEQQKQQQQLLYAQQKQVPSSRDILRRLNDFVSLFPHNSWSFRKGQKRNPIFEQRFRPKVYTLTPAVVGCAHNLFLHAITNNVAVLSSKWIKKLHSNFTKKFVSEVIVNSKRNRFAVKWDGTQHIAVFNYMPAEYWNRSSLSQFEINIAASNKSNGYHLLVNLSCPQNCPLSNQQLHHISKFSWVVEIIDQRLQAHRHQEMNDTTNGAKYVIIVDVVDTVLNERLSFLDRLEIIHSTFNEQMLKFLSDTAGGLLQFFTQQWYGFRDVERATQTMVALLNAKIRHFEESVTLTEDGNTRQRREHTTATSKVDDDLRYKYFEHETVVNANSSQMLLKHAIDKHLPCDGVLLYLNEFDAIFKLKPRYTVDLLLDRNGTLQTQNLVIIAKSINKAFTLSCFLWSEKFVVIECFVDIKQEVDANKRGESMRKNNTNNSDDIRYYISLSFSKMRPDRVTANTFLEFSEIVKASLCGEVIERFVATTVAQ